MPSGLAIASDREPLDVGGAAFLQGRDRGLEISDRLRVGEVVARIAGVELALIRMLEEEIGRQHREAVAGAADRLVHGVLHQAVALVHQDDGRQLGGAGRIGQECRHAVGAGDVLGGDADLIGGDLP